MIADLASNRRPQSMRETQNIQLSLNISMEASLAPTSALRTLQRVTQRGCSIRQRTLEKKNVNCPYEFSLPVSSATLWKQMQSLLDEALGGMREADQSGFDSVTGKILNRKKCFVNRGRKMRLNRRAVASAFYHSVIPIPQFRLLYLPMERRQMIESTT